MEGHTVGIGTYAQPRQRKMEGHCWRQSGRTRHRECPGLRLMKEPHPGTHTDRRTDRQMETHTPTHQTRELLSHMKGQEDTEELRRSSYRA